MSAYPVILELGFRPFFLLAAWYGAAMVALRAAEAEGLVHCSTSLSPTCWHGHEMLFGFATAAVAGFLLTAVANWTGRPTPRGWPLGLLVVLWLAGRVVVCLPLLPLGWSALIDLAFLPALALSLMPCLVAARAARNLIFLPILGWLTVANLLVWLEALEFTRGSAWPGLLIGLLGVLQMIVLIGGRVIPFFAGRALPGYRARVRPEVEWAARLSFPILLGLGWLIPVAIPYLAAAAALIHGLRWSGWLDRRVWSVPLLWVLFAGYAWMVLGLALESLAWLGYLNPLAPVHALTVGCIGMLILGMMSRVALGHTGRELKAPISMTVAYGLLAVAAALRSLGPILWPVHYLSWIGLSGLLWTIAFGLYGLVYFPVVTRPRVDAPSLTNLRVVQN